jgi:glycine cleavage system transcriptional repressor
MEGEAVPGDLIAVTAIGVDREGIVAGVTKVLYDVGCNLEDVSSTILKGHFSMMLIVRAPEGIDASNLEERLAPVASDLNLVITARTVEEAEGRVAAPTHMVSVYGADHPGIVYRVTELLSARGVNVTDLESRVIGEPGEPVYALMLEVSVPAGVDLTSDLEGLRTELEVDASVHPIGADVL